MPCGTLACFDPVVGVRRSVADAVYSSVRAWIEVLCMRAALAELRKRRKGGKEEEGRVVGVGIGIGWFVGLFSLF